MKSWSFCIVLVALASGSLALASDPIGVYAIVDRVVYEPEVGSPERVQIWGAFSLARGIGIGDVYDPPVRGYFYYALPEGQEDVARNEWADLHSVAGTDECVSFGSRYLPIGAVRSGCEAPGTPDVYPVVQGITKVRTQTDYPPINGLVSMPKPLSPVDGSTAATGPVTLTVRNLLLAEHATASYLFEIKDRYGVTETSPAIPPGKTATSWTPSLEVKAGEQYTWRVQAAEDGWSGPPAFACFINTFLRGDANGDKEVDLSDAVALLLYLFGGGAAPVPLAAGDFDGNAVHEVTDGIYLLTFLFLGGPAPPAPFPVSGLTAAS